jgi:tetrahydromethanopterin S-methyltransferase subunit G
VELAFIQDKLYQVFGEKTGREIWFMLVIGYLGNLGTMERWV